MTKNIFYYQTTIGKIGIAEVDGEITHLLFENSSKVPSDYQLFETPLIKKAAVQLEEYLLGKRTSFDLPLNPRGTPFQKNVWNALLTIPYGETRSYKEIAIMVNNPLGYRAVGLANNKNPIAIFIPCHRVVGSDGKLVGFGGGIDLKSKLLTLEKEKVNGLF